MTLLCRDILGVVAYFANRQYRAAPYTQVLKLLLKGSE